MANTIIYVGDKIPSKKISDIYAGLLLDGISVEFKPIKYIDNDHTIKKNKSASK